MIAHSTPGWSVLALLAIVARWIAATAVVWRGRDKDSLPVSTAELGTPAALDDLSGR